MTQHFLRRRALGLAGALGVAALVLSGCGSNADADEDSEDAAGAKAPGEGEEAGEDGDLDTITIGISQFVQHGALDAAGEGFKQAFSDAGYVEGDTVICDEQNAQG